MKVPVISSFLIALGLVSHATAIERPRSLDDPTTAPRAVVEAEEVTEHAALPWLGVFGETPDETLREHLSLEGGVVLRYVAAESPAAAAGLMTHDIVLEFAGQKVNSQEALRQAVSKFVPGEEVVLRVVCKGKEADRKVVLGERPEGMNSGGVRSLVPGANGFLNLEDFPELKERFGELERLFPKGGDGLNLGGDLQAQMDEMGNRLKNLERLPGVDLKIEDLLDDLGKVSLTRRSTVHLTDDQGSVELRMDDGSSEVTVRDLDGDIVYEGPWDTEQDRAAVPPEIAERIEKLHLDEKGNGLRLHFKDGPEDFGFGENPNEK